MVRSKLDTQRTASSQFYIGYLRDAAALFEGAIQHLIQCGLSQCNIIDAIDMAHRIKGNAAMYDYPALGFKAGKVERLLRVNEGTPDPEKFIVPLLSLVEDIRAICGEPERPITLEVDNEGPSHVSQSTADSINRKRIVVAYQDHWMCDLIASLLEPRYTVIRVQTAAEVLNAAATYGPDLVILEDTLGEDTALDLVKSMRAVEREEPIPVFIAFGADSLDSIAQAISLEVAGFTDDKHEILAITGFAKKYLDQPAPSVLVVDDDPMVRELLKHSLSSGGLSVDTVCDGIEALAYLSQNTPDLILLDRFMPRLDGGTVLYEVQNKINLKSIPVLVLTAMVNRGEAKAWFERGAADFIPKPFDPEEVLMRVKQHLEAK